jgi:hypothetical protein
MPGSRVPPLSIELTLGVFDPRHDGRLAPRSSVPSRPAIAWVCTPPGMPLVARERRLEKRRFVGGRSSSRRNCASTGGHTSTLVRRFTGVICRSAKSRIIENLLASEALALRSMPAVPAAIPTPPQLRSTKGRQSEALAPYRLPIRRSGCQALPGSASVGRSVGVWDPAALRAGARAYFGPRPSGWLRGRRQDVDGGSAGRNRHGAWHPRSHERPRPCIAEPARSSQGVGRRFDLPPKQIGAVTPSGPRGSLPSTSK